MDERRRKIVLVIIFVLLIRRTLLKLSLMGQHYAQNMAASCRTRRRCQFRYSMIDKIPKQVEYMNRVIAGDDFTCVNKLRMTKDAFTRLCYLLKHVGGLLPTKYIDVEEKVASFLVILAHHSKNPTVRFDFRRSGQTISRSFHSVLVSLLRLHSILLASPKPITEGETRHQWKSFKGCLGALDGTYIPVTVPLADIPRYRNRKGFVSVNVLGVCDRDMKFIYMLSGWEGPACDARVLRDALSKQPGLKIPQGHYYLVDGGYANSAGFLAPYWSIRYHLKEWEEGHMAPQNAREYFNMKHSKARNVVERSFGLLKKRWAILRSPSFYPIRIQNQIILACGLLHNFIRTHMTVDPMEDEEDEEENTFADSCLDASSTEYIDNIGSSTQWTDLREALAVKMYDEWLSLR